jgi:uncharacterized damage-inducible protein DinB
MPHPLVTQLRFTRSKFFRAIKGVEEVDAQKRIMPMNCISWNVGHLAWQEQQYFLVYGKGLLLIPEIRKGFAYGAPASTPPLKDMLAAWKTITQAADSWLDTLTSATLLENAVSKGKPIKDTYGNLLQRVIYHYWYHLGENMAIRQQLGHKQLPQFVGDIDGKGPYRAE